MKTLYPYLIIGMVIALLPACSSSGKVSSKSKNESGKETVTTDVDEKLRVQLERKFMDALKAKHLGDYEEALKSFEEITKLDPTNDAAYYELAQLYFASNITELAFKNARTAVELQSDNKWYQIILAEVLSVQQEFDKAAEIYGKLATQNPDEMDFYFDWAYMLTRANELQAAIDVYDMLEKKIGLDETLVMQKQRLYLKLGDFKGAAAEIQRLIDENPNDPNYVGILAEMYEAEGNTEEAFKLYEDILEKDPENPGALLALADLSKRQGNHEAYLDYLKRAFANPDVEIDLKITVLYPYIEFFEINYEEIDVAHELAEVLTEVHGDEAKAHAIRGDLLYLDERNEEALVQYYNALALNQDIFQVWQQVMIIESDLDMTDELLQHSEEAIELYPNQALPYYFSGYAHYQKKDNETAIKRYSRGVKVAGTNLDLKAQFYSNLGDVYHRMKNHHASDSCYEESLRYMPDNPYVLNNYSYYLSLREEHLDKAEEMASLANELEPGNASFEDTYAWVLFKKGKFKDALAWQEKALVSGGEERPTLLEHYGDILFKLGRVDEAVEFWQKAMNFGSDSELIGKKIADRQFYE